MCPSRHSILSLRFAGASKGRRCDLACGSNFWIAQKITRFLQQVHYIEPLVFFLVKTPAENNGPNFFPERSHSGGSSTLAVLFSYSLPLAFFPREFLRRTKIFDHTRSYSHSTTWLKHWPMEGNIFEFLTGLRDMAWIMCCKKRVFTDNFDPFRQLIFLKVFFFHTSHTERNEVLSLRTIFGRTQSHHTSFMISRSGHRVYLSMPLFLDPAQVALCHRVSQEQ